MMTTAEIYKNALENLRNLAQRQQELAHRYPNRQAEWRARYATTRAKVLWLEKLLSIWEGER